MDERDQVLAQTAKARLEHQQFIKYEAQAWAALRAKDKELQDREAQLTGNFDERRSFLPKL